MGNQPSPQFQNGIRERSIERHLKTKKIVLHFSLSRIQVLKDFQPMLYHRDLKSDRALLDLNRTGLF